MKIIESYNIASDTLISGGIGVIPTDTVYGIVAKASDVDAVTKLYALKNREHKPGTVIAANIQQLIKLGVPESILKKIDDRFWPGPISVVIDLTDKFDYLHQGVGGVAFRVVDNPKTKVLLEKTGPLLTSSANQPGMPTSININEAINYFGDSIDFYLDGGEITNQPPSTIIRIVDNNIEILRQGAAKIDLSS